MSPELDWLCQKSIRSIVPRPAREGLGALKKREFLLFGTVVPLSYKQLQTALSIPATNGQGTRRSQTQIDKVKFVGSKIQYWKTLTHDQSILDVVNSYQNLTSITNPYYKQRKS